MIVYTDKHRVPFQIDEDDYAAVSQRAWCISQGYPRTRIGQRWLTLHLFLLGLAPPGLKWDHRDRDKLNNQRSNFRAVTETVNKRNVGIKRTNTSGVKGVSWDRDLGRWRVRIKVNRRQRHIGLFDTLDAAAGARQAAERALWNDGA